MRRKMAEKRALSEATRMSAARAKARPAPTAGPLTAAITGLVSSRIGVTQSDTVPILGRRDLESAMSICERSAPALKARPSPVMMTTRVASSCLRSVKICSMRRKCSDAKLFSTSGRLNRTVVTKSLVSTRMSESFTSASSRAQHA